MRKIVLSILKLSIHFRLLFLFLFLFSFFSSCQKGSSLPPRAIGGILDLKDWDFDTQGILLLDGEWEFYWNRFVSYEDLMKSDPPLNDGHILVPSNWNTFQIDSKSIPRVGYCTYILRVKNNKNKKLFILNNVIGSAFKIYVNNKIVYEVGSIGITSETHVPKYKIAQIELGEVDKDFILLIQVSNFSYNWGGIYYPLTLGNFEDISLDYKKSYLMEVFLIGSLFITGIYHISVFLNRKKDKTSLYFGLLCLSTVLREASTGNHLFNDLFPDLSWEWGMKLEYVSLIFMIYAYYSYLKSLYSRSFSMKINKFVLWTAISFYLLIFLTSPLFFPKFLTLIQLFSLFSINYVIYILYKCYKRGEEFSGKILILIISLFFVVIVDILKSEFYLHIPFLLPWGVFIFIFAQSYILSVRFSRSFDQVRVLSNDLEKRSKQLEESNQSITDLNKLLNSLNESPDLESTMKKIMSYIQSKYGMTYFLLGLLGEDAVKGKIIYAKLPEYLTEEEVAEVYAQNPVIKGGRGAHAYSFKSRQPLFFPKIRLKGVSEAEKIILTKIRAKSFVIVPLIFRGEIVGILDLWKEGSFELQSSELMGLATLGEQLAGNIYTSLLFKKVEEEKDKAKSAYFELEASQKQLVQSDRMITLGTLVAGVAHEINSPLGAIKANSENIQESMREILFDLKKTNTELKAEDWDFLFFLLDKASLTPKNYSTKEQRALRKSMVQKLEEIGTTDSETFADQILGLGLEDTFSEISPQFSNPQFPQILKIVENLHGIRKKAKVIDSSASRVSKIVKSLKSFMHFDQKEEMILSDLSDGLETVLTILHNQLKQGVDVVRNYEDVPHIYCYPDELNQIWTNLIHNAIQAMQGKGQITVELKVVEETLGQKEVLISVEDNGPGIPPEIQKKIFEPFFTTKPAGEGSGLGLHIIGKILEKHKGRIQLESEPGKTKFSIFLPAKTSLSET
jgi:signal transduction histidine kinase